MHFEWFMEENEQGFIQAGFRMVAESGKDNEICERWLEDIEERNDRISDELRERMFT